MRVGYNPAVSTRLNTAGLPPAGFILSAILLLYGAACTRTESRVWVPGWKESVPIQTPRSAAKAVVVGEYLYVIGGVRPPIPQTTLDSVEFARINPDGTLGPWTYTSRLNTPRMFLSVSKANGIIYAVGGQYFPEGHQRLLETVERAAVGPDGRLGPWTESSPMLTPRRSPTSTIVDGYLYGIGGFNGTFLRTLERARIREDGALDKWEAVRQPMENAHYIHGGATRDGRIYVVGGHIQGVGTGDSSTEWTTVGGDGRLSSWKSGSSLHQPRFLAGSTATNDYIFVIGGYDGSYLSSVEQVRILPEGDLGEWTQVAALPTAREGAAVASHNDTIYAIGGSQNGQYMGTVEFAQIGRDGSLGHWEEKSGGTGG